MKSVSQVLSIITMILGVIGAYYGYQEEYAGSTLVLISGIVVFVGIAIFACIHMHPSFGNSLMATIVSLIACAGGGMWALEMLIRTTGSATTPLMIAGGGLVALSFILCPCMCMQTNSKAKDNVIGVAAAHESITLTELSQKTGLPVEIVSSIVYEAVGKGQLSGHMDGNTFKRTGPAPSVSHDAKVLVICQYCGAKTEQGLSKCQKCGADI